MTTITFSSWSALMRHLLVSASIFCAADHFAQVFCVREHKRKIAQAVANIAKVSQESSEVVVGNICISKINRRGDKFVQNDKPNLTLKTSSAS